MAESSNIRVRDDIDLSAFCEFVNPSDKLASAANPSEYATLLAKFAVDDSNVQLTPSPAASPELANSLKNTK
jgi:hypothetical protein